MAFLKYFYIKWHYQIKKQKKIKSVFIPTLYIQIMRHFGFCLCLSKSLSLTDIRSRPVDWAKCVCFQIVKSGTKANKLII